MLKDFEKKFSKLLLAERHLLETRKVELFLQAADEGLEDRLLLLFGDRTTEGGFHQRLEEGRGDNYSLGQTTTCKVKGCSSKN